MMTYSGNRNYNALIAGLKPNARKHPGSNSRKPYSYMLSAQDRMVRFIERMTGVGGNENDQINLDGLVQ